MKYIFSHKSSRLEEGSRCISWEENCGAGKTGKAVEDLGGSVERGILTAPFSNRELR